MRHSPQTDTPSVSQTLATLVAPENETPPLTPEQSHDTEEDAALCACYEEEQRQRQDSETLHGCDWPDGPLAFAGCRW